MQLNVIYFTVTLIYKDHPKDYTKVALMCRWSVYEVTVYQIQIVETKTSVVFIEMFFYMEMVFKTCLIALNLEYIGISKCIVNCSSFDS